MSLTRSARRITAARWVGVAGASPPGLRTGPKPRAGVANSETKRFRCTEAEAAEIDAACAAAGRDLSDVARELLLAWSRRQSS